MPIRTQLLKCGWVRTQKNTWDLRCCPHVYTQSHQCPAVAVDVRQTGSRCRRLSTVVVAHSDVSSHSVHTALVSCHQWRRQGGRGELPPNGGRPKIMLYVCAFVVMELLRITRRIHCKAVEQRATLIHRQLL